MVSGSGARRPNSSTAANAANASSGASPFAKSDGQLPVSSVIYCNASVASASTPSAVRDSAPTVPVLAQRPSGPSHSTTL